MRYYKPYSIKLLAFNHDFYPGTDIPKNFSSRIHLTDPATGEDRDVLIYMNNPLRYHGETYLSGELRAWRQRHDFASGAQSRLARALHRLFAGGAGIGRAIPDCICSASPANGRRQTKPAPAREAPAAPPLEPALANGKGRRL